jgi:drug/metabolite transporter (DMT)-like permease
MCNDIVKNQLILILAVLLYRINDCLSKVMIAQFPVMDLMFYRSVGTILLLPAFFYFGGISLKGFFEPKLLLRNSLAAVALFLEVGSLEYISLGTFVLLSYLAPVIIKVLARLTLKEQFTQLDWLFICISLIGTYLIVNSSLESNALPGICMALAGAILFAACIIVTKTMNNPDYNTMYVSYILLICILGACTVPTVIPQGVDYLILIMMAIIHVAAFMMHIKAYRVMKTSRAAVLEYMGLVFALSLDYLVWGQVISPQKLSGGLIILSASVFSIYRDSLLLWAKKHKIF